ncbi:MAG: imidazolonepropionase [Fervidobacterium sp.]
MLVIHADRLLTPIKQPVKGTDMRSIEELFDVDIVVDGGYVIDIRRHKSADYSAKLVTPGLFDAHTHIPFIGSRSKEFLMRARGKTYLEILHAGGGIHYTTALVKKSSEEELYKEAKRYVDAFTRHGIVGLECKSGYGLDKENELKQLRVIKKLKSELPNRITSTFLGLHAKPLPDSGKSVNIYIKEMTELLDVIKQEELADFVDAFVDKGVYLPEELSCFFEKAKAIGFKVRLHADELENVGACRFGEKIGAISVDHVLKISKEDISTLSHSNTLVTLMPATSFYLGESYAPAREIINNGIGVALGSDFNPGSSPIYYPGFVMHLAIRFLKMDPEEVLNAYTANSAYVLGFKSGILAPGYPADMVLWSTSEFLDIPYMFQENWVEKVLIGGKLCV